MAGSQLTGLVADCHYARRNRVISGFFQSREYAESFRAGGHGDGFDGLTLRVKRLGFGAVGKDYFMLVKQDVEIVDLGLIVANPIGPAANIVRFNVVVVVPPRSGL